MRSYYYLSASLPILAFGTAPPLSETEFLARCREQLTDADFRVLQACSLLPDDAELPSGSAAARFRSWETCLRNLLAGKRTVPGGEAGSYWRHEDDFFSEIAPGVQEALAVGNVLEREKALDQLRFRALDWLEAGHLFDLDHLCIYKLKLALLAKYQPFDPERGAANLDAIIAEVARRSGRAEAPEQPMQENTI